MAMKAAQEQSPVNTVKKTRPTQVAPVSMTAADLQRQNREVAQKRKTLGDPNCMGLRNRTARNWGLSSGLSTLFGKQCWI